MTRLRGLPPRTLDRLLAAVLAVFGVTEAIVVAEGSGAERGLAVAMVLVMTATIAFRRRARRCRRSSCSSPPRSR